MIIYVASQIITVRLILQLFAVLFFSLVGWLLRVNILLLFQIQSYLFSWRLFAHTHTHAHFGNYQIRFIVWIHSKAIVIARRRFRIFVLNKLRFECFGYASLNTMDRYVYTAAIMCIWVACTHSMHTHTNTLPLRFYVNTPIF